MIGKFLCDYNSNQVSDHYPLMITEKGKVVDPYLEREVKNTMTLNSAKMQACYNKYVERQKEKATSGKIHFDWFISKKGASSNIRIIYSTFADHLFSKCLSDVISEMSFPPSGMKRYSHHKLKFSLAK